MACDVRTTGIVLEGCNVSWGKKNKTCITPVFPVVESSYFTFSSTTTDYVAWINDGAGVDPAIVGKTSIEVDTSAATDEADVVTAFKTAIETASAAWVTISTDGLSFDLENKKVGAVTATADVDTTFTFASQVVGVGGDLGKTEAIELSMEVESFDVTSNQTGSIILDKIVTGSNAEISTELLQMTSERWSELVGAGLGNNFTPSGGTEVTGYGSDSINRSFFDVAGELVLHPVRLPESDRSRDITFHQTVCNPESINFDSTEKQAMSVTFSALLDESKDSKVNLFTFGDSAQDLRA